MFYRLLKRFGWFGVLGLLFTPALMLAHHYEHRCCGWGDTTPMTECGCCWLDGHRIDPIVMHGTVGKFDLRSDGGLQTVEIKTDQGQEVSILLAPVWYLKDQTIEMKVGDILTATCARLNASQENRFVGMELRFADGRSFKLRDDQGFPVWLGGRAHCCAH
jgi:hypothetical protein